LGKPLRVERRLRLRRCPDGEGRNGIFLAERGLLVHSVEGAAAAIAKAKRLAASRGVTLTIEQADLFTWDWPVAVYDAVVAIFVQFATPAERPMLFEHIKQALKPGGLLLLEGYRVEQLTYRTGGPSNPEHLYTEALLRDAFADMSIIALKSYDAVIEEGTGHSGMSALIDLIAVRPA
jgi:cyclopropane fatty-acyl-phospholipid synthase-like methyltransferase